MIHLCEKKLVPGKPEVSVEQPEMAVVVSWTLKEKNGIIKEYHVTYIREDENSETKTLATKKMEARFDLKAGKTYQLQVETFYYLSELIISLKSLLEKKGLFKATKEQSVKYLRLNVLVLLRFMKYK